MTVHMCIHVLATYVKRPVHGNKTFLFFDVLTSNDAETEGYKIVLELRTTGRYCTVIAFCAGAV
jgi:hypothetical protein